MNNEIKIIAGELRGRKIYTLPSQDTRPLLSRVRKSLFDIIKLHLAYCHFLDLYAGSGSVGIEALSRGAEKVIFIEQGNAANELIKNNIKKMGITDRSQVLLIDVLSYLKDCNGKFDIIFSGPPYFSGENIKVLEIIAFKNILNKNGLLICQQHKNEKYTEKTGNIKLIRNEKYGDMRLIFYENRII